VSPVENASGSAGFLEGMRRLSADVSRETQGRLETLVGILERWQGAINLVSRGTLGDVWERHILDSAQAVRLLPTEARTLTDLGSGGGFPGLVLAVLRPDLQVTLVEADARKGAFLGEASRRLALPKPPKILVQRLEAGEPAPADIVTARALAPLAQLLSWAAPYRSDPAICLFHKGKGWQGELTEAQQDWEIDVQPFSSVTDRDAVLLHIGSYRAKDFRDR
jgi:16S rRNA (guanine527-N7)-methyltransferase